MNWTRSTMVFAASSGDVYDKVKERLLEVAEETGVCQFFVYKTARGFHATADPKTVPTVWKPFDIILL